MTLENWITEVSNHLPNYTARTYLLAFFFVWIVLSILLHKLSKKEHPFIFKHIYLVFIPFFLILISTLSFLNHKYLLNIFENKLEYFFIPILLFLILIALKYLFLFLKKNFVTNIICKIELIILILISVFTLIFSLFSCPTVHVDSNAKILQTTDEITLIFSSPVPLYDLKINIHPESNIELEYKYFLGIKGFVEEIKIIPLESFLPEQKVVVYTTGIQRLFPNGTKHENSQEFFTPKIPEIEGIVLGTDIENVSIEQPITLDLDGEDQNFIEWDAIFIPEATYEIKRGLGDYVVIQPLKLKQGTEYELQIVKSIIRYNPNTLKKLSTESEEIVEKVSFKTAPAPGIDSYNRSGQIISNSEPLIINFKDALKEQTLEGKTHIDPQIEGNFFLSEDKKQLIFQPKGSFAKNTEYKVTIEKGVENILGGYVEEDLILTFKTPGVLAISYAIPRNSTKNISTSTKNVSLTFNQPVNQKSVVDRFSISPNITGSFSWKDSTLYYNFSQNLLPGTKYTIQINSGAIPLYGIENTKSLVTTFTTKYETFMLSVPLFYQAESFTCNLAATRMVLSYRGVSSSENAIRDSIGIGLDPNSNWVTKYGVHWNPISSYISNRGVTNYVKRGWNLTSALQEVKAGHPVLVYVYNGYTQPKGYFELPGGYDGYKGMHSEVIVGYVGTPESPITVITNDPWRGKRYLTPSTFLSLWSYLNYTGIVIY